MTIEIGERLKAERQRLGMPPAEFGALCGVSRTTQFNYEGGGRVPDAAYLQKACKAGVDVQYVITGSKSGGGDDNFVVIQAQVAAVGAGPDAEHGEHADIEGLSFSRKWLARKGLSASKLRVIEVVGESMRPRLNEGDKVLVDTSDTLPRSGRVYVLRQGNELLVKYCQLLPGDVLRVSSANADYPTYDIDLSKVHDVSIVGRVRASANEW